jgi:hypothetical protein
MDGAPIPDLWKAGGTVRPLVRRVCRRRQMTEVGVIPSILFAAPCCVK